MSEVERILKEKVKKLVTDGTVDLAIGFEKGSLPLSSRPFFMKSADDVDRLVWNFLCTNNLAVYLPRLFPKNKSQEDNGQPPKIGIIVKECDARSVAGLVIENQVPKEHITVISVPCEGVLDRKKVKAILKNEDLSHYEEGKDHTIRIRTQSGQEIILEKKDIMSDSCLECSYPLAVNADIMIEGESKKPVDEDCQKIKKFENKSIEDRWAYFKNEMAKCIRCYACRQACPNCYCESCFADQTRPGWIGRGANLSDIMSFHIGRIFHQAGRCVECGACERACPMGIDLRTFTGKLAKDIKALYGFTPGLSPDAIPPLCAFTQNDNEAFITEP